MKNNIYSVSQVNNYLKLVLQDDVLLNRIFIKGEISNFKKYSSGNLFFSLKDENSVLSCIMYSQYSENLDFEIYNGTEVICFGYVSIYEKTGQYQLCVSSIEVCGKGNLYLEFENLKKKLDELDIFNPKFKKKIPKNPSTITVITSPEGAVFYDILNVSARRNPNVKIVLVPISVQGESSKKEIVEAIEDVNKWGKTDTIILARGGGSIEDLWSFNEEDVAMAIFNSKIPIISAIGHEVDFTISDFVSDLRASTPSVAGEIAVPAVFSLKSQIIKNYIEINNSLNKKIAKNKFDINYIINSSDFKNFSNKLDLYKNNIENIKKNINIGLNSKIKENKLILQNSIENLENKSPINILKKGYSIIYDNNKNIVKNKENVKNGDILNIKLFDGNIKAKVIEER